MQNENYHVENVHGIKYKSGDGEALDGISRDVPNVNKSSQLILVSEKGLQNLPAEELHRFTCHCAIQNKISLVRLL
jgi:hypothetical protein